MYARRIYFFFLSDFCESGRRVVDGSFSSRRPDGGALGRFAGLVYPFFGCVTTTITIRLTVINLAVDGYGCSSAAGKPLPIARGVAENDENTCATRINRYSPSIARFGGDTVFGRFRANTGRTARRYCHYASCINRTETQNKITPNGFYRIVAENVY